LTAYKKGRAKDINHRRDYQDWEISKAYDLTFSLFKRNTD